ncbi:acyltransferase [Lachnospiraceae bacterium C1.1]|nr:acyltransferase [Lachnospiraceae bacterium C1.1]
MNIIDRILNKIVSYKINHKIFPKELAKKMPIYCSWHVKWGDEIKKNSIQLNTDEVYKGMIQIGFDRIATGLLGGKESSIIIEGNGKLIFTGKADLSQGISVHVLDDAVLTIGGGIYTNGYCSIRCSKKITIGRNAMWGWNVFVMDTDGHPIYDMDKNIINFNKDIIIGDDVWLGADSRVLKGAVVPDGCIVGIGSTVTRKETKRNVIMAGSPSKIVKECISWSREEFPKK